MTQDVQQWLAEIQSLQQRLAHVSQERATAYEQLARWQRSYQTEAQQRRKDIRRLQTVIYHLDQENKRLKQQLELPLVDPVPSPPQQPQIHQKLKEAIAECDRLSKALSQEQAEHEQTRQTLMTALGDTVEQLERERKRHDQSKPSNSYGYIPITWAATETVGSSPTPLS